MAGEPPDGVLQATAPCARGPSGRAGGSSSRRRRAGWRGRRRRTGRAACACRRAGRRSRRRRRCRARCGSGSPCRRRGRGRAAGRTGSCPAPPPARRAGRRRRRGARRSPRRWSWPSGGSRRRGSRRGPGRATPASAYRPARSSRGHGEHLLPHVDLGQRHRVGHRDLHDDRPAGDLRVHLAGQGRAALDGAQGGAGLVGPGDEGGPRDRHAVAHGELGELVDEQARARSTPGSTPLPSSPSTDGQRVHLVDLGEAAGHRPAVGALVGGLAGGREPDGAGLDRLADDGRASSSTSSAVAGRSSAPTTKRRSGVWPMKAPTFRRFGRSSIARRYSGNDSKHQSMPASSDSSAMPSTFSSVRAMTSRCSGRVGATPNPQLPMTTLVTPCQLDGVRSPSHRIWAS